MVANELKGEQQKLRTIIAMTEFIKRFVNGGK